jgi:hypothetical protein
MFKILFSLVLITNSIFAHSGGTNSDGCHNDYSNNTYHCHNSGSDSGESDSAGGAIIGLVIVAIVGVIYYYFFRNQSHSISSNTGTTNHNFQEKCQIFIQNGVVVSVKSVEILEFPKMSVIFNTNEKKIFDVSPYMDKEIFTEFQNQSYFKQAKATHASIAWPNGQDFCSDTLYIKGVSLAPTLLSGNTYSNIN